MIEVVTKPTPNQIAELANNMSELDQQEVWAAGHVKPYDALASSILASREAWVWNVHGQPMCMFGVASSTLTSLTGAPWFLSSKNLPLHRYRFLRHCKTVVERWNDEFDVLRNYVDARHLVAVKWIKWMGFTVHEPINMGPDNLPFHMFEMTKPWAKPPLQLLP